MICSVWWFHCTSCLPSTSCLVLIWLQNFKVTYFRIFSPDISGIPHTSVLGAKNQHLKFSYSVILFARCINIYSLCWISELSGAFTSLTCFKGVLRSMKNFGDHTAWSKKTNITFQCNFALNCDLRHPKTALDI